MFKLFLSKDMTYSSGNWVFSFGPSCKFSREPFCWKTGLQWLLQCVVYDCVCGCMWCAIHIKYLLLILVWRPRTVWWRGFQAQGGEPNSCSSAMKTFVVWYKTAPSSCHVKIWLTLIYYICWLLVAIMFNLSWNETLKTSGRQCLLSLTILVTITWHLWTYYINDSDQQITHITIYNLSLKAKAIVSLRVVNCRVCCTLLILRHFDAFKEQWHTFMKQDAFGCCIVAFNSTSPCSRKMKTAQISLSSHSRSFLNQMLAMGMEGLGAVTQFFALARNTWYRRQTNASKTLFSFALAVHVTFPWHALFHEIFMVACVECTLKVIHTLPWIPTTSTFVCSPLYSHMVCAIWVMFALPLSLLAVPVLYVS